MWLKPLLVDLAINKGKVLLGVELHFPFNLPFSFRKCILTTLQHHTTVISSSSPQRVDGMEKDLAGASSSTAAYKHLTKRTKGFCSILRSVINTGIDLTSYYVIGLLQIEESLH